MSERGTLVTNFEIRVAADLADFDDLWPRTDECKSAHCYAFQYADILKVWCDTVGKARATRVLFTAVLDEIGRPVLLLPLGIERHRGVRILRFLDGGVSDYNAPILFEPIRIWNRDNVEQLWQRLLIALPTFDVAMFEKMPADICGLPNPFVNLGVTPYHSASYLTDLTGTWVDYAGKLPHKRRTRDKRRSLGNLGHVRFTIAQTQTDRMRVLQAMMRQKTRRYIETRGVDGFDRPGFRQYFIQMTERFAWPGPLVLAALELDDEILSTLWGFMVDSRFYYIAPSFEAGQWTRFSPGRLLLEDLIKWCFEKRIRVFDLGMGDENYKLGFADQKIVLYQSVIPATLVGKAYEIGRKTPVWRLLKRAMG
jgi:CelD/BcsL family acetyltransferase involved in cellulose biosynthesis